MRVAIASTGNALSDNVDLHFGRCEYFVFYDTDNGQCEFVLNPNRDKEENVGPESVQLITSYGAEKVVSREFGFRIKSLMMEKKIQMIVLQQDKTIEEVIGLLVNNGKGK